MKIHGLKSKSVQTKKRKLADQSGSSFSHKNDVVHTVRRQFLGISLEKEKGGKFYTSLLPELLD